MAGKIPPSSSNGRQPDTPTLFSHSDNLRIELVEPGESSVWNLDQLHPRSGAALDRDSALRALELFRDELDQFLIRLPVDRRRFDRRFPRSIFQLLQGTDPGVGFDFDLERFHRCRKKRNLTVPLFEKFRIKRMGIIPGPAQL